MGFDAVRAAIGAVKDVRSLGGGTESQQKAVDQAIEQAETATKLAEAEIGKALGYELCKCEFPPTLMLTVGYHKERGGRPKGPVYECPKCGYNTAGPWMYERIAPERSIPR
jgi:hypothetical protein